MNNTICPLCGAHEQYRYKEKSGGYKTHVWVCEFCSHVSFEFIDNEDIDNLKLLLN